jgi:biopolymer transport protein ExbD
MASKLRKAGAGLGDDCALDMSPMIDMVFLLLIFFVVNSSAIVVKQDAQVKPPVASYGKKQEEVNGRIVINVFQDGTFKDEMGKPLLSDEDIIEHVTTKREANEQKSYKSKLHLRGDKDAVFKHSRKVIAASAKAGVDQVMFATYLNDR